VGYPGIQSGAFSDLENLYSLTITGEVGNITTGAFYNVTGEKYMYVILLHLRYDYNDEQSKFRIYSRLCDKYRHFNSQLSPVNR